MLFIKRKVPLDICPNLGCVRSGRCRARRPEQECRKFQITMDEWRNEVAAQLEAIHVEFLANNPGHVPRQMSDEEFRYEARKALCEVCIEDGIMGAAVRMPPAKSMSSEELQQLREGRAPKREAETAPLDPPGGSS